MLRVRSPRIAGISSHLRARGAATLVCKSTAPFHLSMNQVIAAALEVEAFCKEMGFRHCIIGGVALHRWGEPRQTKDVDLTVLTGFGGEEPIVDSFLQRFKSRRP